MSNYQSPGVYIEEVPSGPQPIAAAPTSVMAILGTTRKGPVLAPTRVSSWADYVRTFGAPTSRGYTGESVFGFFENGGPAAWVVRVDPSTSANWVVRDVGGAESFTVTALTPGAWGNDIDLAIAPDEGGGTGTYYRAATTGAATVAGDGTSTLPVASTAGLNPGERLSIVVIPASDTVAAPMFADVVSCTPTAITISGGSAGAVPAGSVVASATATAATSITLANGSGFRPGDVVVAVAPNGTRTGAVVTDVAVSGTATALTLEAALGANVPGAAFVQRRAAFKANVAVTGTPANTPPRTSIPFNALGWEKALAAPVASELTGSSAQRAAARITMPDGRTGTWSSGSFDIVGTTPPPSGAVTVEAAAMCVLLADEGLSITGLTSADPTGSYGFLPPGAQVTYTGGGGVPAIVATRAGSGFSLSAVPAATDTYTTATFTLQANANAGIAVRCALKPRVDDRIALDTTPAPTPTYAAITDVVDQGGDVYLLRFANGTAISTPGQTRFGLYAVESAAVRSSRFSLSVNVNGVQAEQITGLSLNPSHPSYFAKDGVVNDASELITVAPRPGGAPPISLAAAPFYVQDGVLGTDKPPANNDFRQGLSKLEAVPEPAMLICPDALTLPDPLLTADVVGQVITHCESFRRFAIVDPPDFDEDEDQDLLAWRNTTLSSTYAAMYAPHLRIVNLVPESQDRFESVPPSGFVAGVFARTDRLRGVHKAAGNEQVTGIVGLTQSYTQRRQDALNPNGVNLIRSFPGRGTRLWGARNATDDATWRYINVRRLFNMIETSVDRATQWVVFEPNTAQTWIRVKVSVENFLDQQWRAGALAGTTPEQAFRVRVGLGETMTESDIDNGYLIVEVAIAPAKPAEFVVFRFSHKRLSE